MNLKQMAADGPADSAHWLERSEPVKVQRLERPKPVQWLHKWLNAHATAKRQVTSLGANLLSLQTEMRHQAKNGCWIVVVL